MHRLKVAVVVEAQVDGFRFDLMGHIMVSVMERARDALCALTVERHGVDGSKIYLYGEGWDYAEVSRERDRERVESLARCHDVSLPVCDTCFDGRFSCTCRWRTTSVG